MAISKLVHLWARIVPLRFTRAPHPTDPNVDSGAPDANAPDPDDRGFQPAAHGCAVIAAGVDEAVNEAERPETRIRVIREDIENGATLHVTSSDTNIVAITLPAANAALPNQQNMMIKFRAKNAGECFLEVRFEAIDGPIIHRLRVIVNAMRDVRLTAHVPQINGTALNDTSGTPVPSRSVRTDAQIRGLINDTNAIYFPYGLRFVLDAAINRAGPVLNFTNRGFANDQTNEFTQTTAHNRTAGAINMYFVPQIGNATEADQVGGSANSAVGSPTTFGSLIADMATGGQTVAHELGHVLNLVNDPRNRFIHVNTVRDPAIPGTGRDIRDDMISRRRMMWAYTNLLANANMPYRDNVGYGATQPGSMLAIKQLDADRTDWEMQEVQRTAARLGAPAGP